MSNQDPTPNVPAESGGLESTSQPSMTPPLVRDPSAPVRFDFLHDVPMQVTVELGSKSMPLEAILNLGPGATIELDKANGEPLDIKVNGVLIARGEAVIVNERFGVRIVSVTSHAAESLAAG